MTAFSNILLDLGDLLVETDKCDDDRRATLDGANADALATKLHSTIALTNIFSDYLKGNFILFQEVQQSNKVQSYNFPQYLNISKDLPLEASIF